MIVVGITGFRRSGKNTTTRILAGQFGFTEYGFADALRTMALAVDPFISTAENFPSGLRQQLESYCEQNRSTFNHVQLGACRYSVLLAALGYEGAKEVPDCRRYLQRLGTEGVRGTFGSEAWVNALGHRVSNEKPERICIPDVRFASEAAWVRRMGGHLWRTVRPGVGGTDLHQSEVEMQSLTVDHTITASTLEDLESAVVSAAHRYVFNQPDFVSRR